jgi:hypothetical protein
MRDPALPEGEPEAQVDLASGEVALEVVGRDVMVVVEALRPGELRRAGVLGGRALLPGADLVGPWWVRPSSTTTASPVNRGTAVSASRAGCAVR